MQTSPSKRPRSWRSPAIDEVAVISNGLGELALLDRKGNVTSWNLPDADGVPVCHELYDAPWETAFRLRLDDRKTPVGRRLEDTSHTLVSTWTNATGKACERAFIAGSPLASAGGRFARLLTCEQGTVRARLDLRLRHGHRGEEKVRWTVLRERDGFLEAKAAAGSSTLLLSTNMHLRFDEDATSIRGELALDAGCSAFVCIGWNGHTSPATVEDVEDLLRESEEGWLAWARELRIPDDGNAALVLGSAIRLRGLGHRAGSFYAAASRGLPEDDPREHPRAVRTWDYLCDWLRDSGLTVSTLHRLGDAAVLPARLEWYRSLPDLGRKAKVMYRMSGGDVARFGEHIVDGLGHRGSVYRFGNGAGDQEQHDRWVYPLEHLRLLSERGRFDLGLTEGLAEQAVRAAGKPCSGIWEVRRPEDDLVAYASTQILVGQALFNTAAVFAAAGLEEPARRYRGLGERLKAWVLDNCVLDGVVVAAPGLPVLDASALLAFHVGKDMFNLRKEGDRDLVRATVLAIDTPHTVPSRFQGLRVGKGHVRYHTHQFGDGVSQAEEALFTSVTGLVALTMLRLGMLDRADAVMREVLDARNDLGMWSEERTEDGRGLGNVSQAYVYQTVIDYFVNRAEFIAAAEHRSETAA
ncbi:glycoside hydrolase family 15 protein [Actinomadura violacea]|uniref:GH15-like domain-containing protein n=1 Tax=Actinomadura violacea TaxID=2819934 RepID=A0ABS3RHR5_9ACTN|nr:glycoside hydrolase family 15 protein [Actinomadura violacea]MBO2456270.1 hypothetical protein [Actinomadura violacea]